MPTTALPERLTPLASRLGYRAWYGDIHNHCGLSYGHGRLEDALARARVLEEDTKNFLKARKLIP